MGAVNCCVDCTVDDYPTGATTQHITPGSAPTRQTSAAFRDSQAAVVTDNAFNEEIRGKESSLNHIVSQDASSQPQKQHLRQRKKRDANFIPDTRPLRLKNYLCSCDPCPLSLRIDRLVGAIHGEHPADDENTVQLVEAFRRVLRGYATYDETRPLDTRLARRVHDLLQAPHVDEDQVFRSIVLQPYHQANAATSA